MFQLQLAKFVRIISTAYPYMFVFQYECAKPVSMNDSIDKIMSLFSDDKRAHDVLGASATIEISQYPSLNSLNNNQKVKSV